MSIKHYVYIKWYICIYLHVGIWVVKVDREPAKEVVVLGRVVADIYIYIEKETGTEIQGEIK